MIVYVQKRPQEAVEVCVGEFQVRAATAALAEVLASADVFSSNQAKLEGALRHALQSNPLNVPSNGLSLRYLYVIGKPMGDDNEFFIPFVIYAVVFKSNFRRSNIAL